MIRLLQGKIHGTEDRTIILLTGGVGYHVFVPNDLLNEEGEITLYIHTHVREDQFTLYGFRTQKDLKFFELLLTINGVGPKMAIAILNEPADQIQNAIFTKNIKALTKIPGVGKKIADRIILELKSKVTPVDGAEPIEEETEIHPDIVTTLEGLGYKRKHITNVLSKMDEKVEEEEEIIRYFLQHV